MRDLRISVRRLVEFLLRAGDIDGEGQGQAGIDLMLAGSDIHRKLQAAGGDSYQAEVSLSGSIYFPVSAFNPHAARLDIRPETVEGQEGFFLTLEGRADGIIDDGAHPLTIDEIKGVARDVATIEEPEPLHEAQALCYAYLYLRKTRGPQALSVAYAERVCVRLTYASMDTGEVRQLESRWSIPDIESWFFELMGKAKRWATWRSEHDAAMQRALGSLTFPLTPRAGQAEIMDAVATTIRKKGRLFVQAPTGSGKTLATLYPALKAMGEGEASRIAFLTAKTITRRAALEAVDLLRKQDIASNILVTTARDKICPLLSNAQEAQMRSRPLTSLCNPYECPRARGHFDRVNDALFELITQTDVLDHGNITQVATRHNLCPYELQRDAALWSDLIICDYHYAFAPSASLLGTADEPGGTGTLFLVDEAHNLPDRLREMYSAEIESSDLKQLERLLAPIGALADLTKALRLAIAAFPKWDKALPAGKTRTARSAYQKVSAYEGFTDALAPLIPLMEDALEAYLPTASNDSPAKLPIETYLTLRDVSFKVRGLMGALQRAEKGYVTFLSKGRDSGRKLKVFCVNPAHDLEERLKEAKAAVFFSGTLLPMDYHLELLAAREEDQSIYATSGFDANHLQVLIATDVDCRYQNRGPDLYARIASYLASLASLRPGNYLAYLPSHQMLGQVAEAMRALAHPSLRIIRQMPGMREEDREDFVDQFRKPRPVGSSLVGLCVLGGIFGESIDLPGDQLIGVAIAGTGMPPVSSEREVIRDYFDAKEKGFAYAYTYPGMNKVLQAAGRLIRTEEDRGVILLLDERFLQDDLQEAFPKEWTNRRTCTLKTLPALIAHNNGPKVLSGQRETPENRNQL